MVGEQTNPAQTQVGKNLGTNADFSLYFAFTLRERGQRAFAVERKERTVPDLLDREALRGLVKVDQRSTSF